jgi:high-affinity iron transporter
MWHGVVSLGNPKPVAAPTNQLAAIFDIAVLVLREGLECILVLAAITAGLTGERQRYRQSIAAGAGIGLVATLATWCVAVRILDDVSTKVSALQLQAATGLLAVIVLLIVMNWFFHKIYWTGWISLHNRRKRELLEESHSPQTSGKLFRHRPARVLILVSGRCRSRPVPAKLPATTRKRTCISRGSARLYFLQYGSGAYLHCASQAAV